MRIIRPIIIIGAPRSGTTLLFSILSSHPDLWSLYRESWIIEKYLHPKKFGWSRGNTLGIEDASDGTAELLKLEFYKRVINYQTVFPNSCSTIYTNRFRERVTRKIYQVLVSPFLKPEEIRIVEKTPKNCLRIPFLNTIFPDSFFIFLTRDPRTNISSLMEGWKEFGRFQTYHLPGGVEIENYSESVWKFLLPPGWEKYTRTRLEQVCAFQYRAANQRALEDLSQIPEDRKMVLQYEDLVASPTDKVRLICHKAELRYQGGLKNMAEKMPPVNTSSLPDKSKWKKNESEVMSIIETVKDLSERIGYTL